MAKSQIKKKSIRKNSKATRLHKKESKISSSIAKSSVSYVLNTEFEFFEELRDLILKSSYTEKKEITQQVRRLGIIKLAVIAGIFLDKESKDPMSADLLIVCEDVNMRRWKGFLKSLESDVGKEIKFAIMDKEEFVYRLSMFDRFVRVLLEGPHEVLIDKLGIEL